MESLSSNENSPDFSRQASVTIFNDVDITLATEPITRDAFGVEEKSRVLTSEQLEQANEILRANKVSLLVSDITLRLLCVPPDANFHGKVWKGYQAAHVYLHDDQLTTLYMIKKNNDGTTELDKSVGPRDYDSSKDEDKQEVESEKVPEPEEIQAFDPNQPPLDIEAYLAKLAQKYNYQDVTEPDNSESGWLEAFVIDCLYDSKPSTNELNALVQIVKTLIPEK